MGGEWHACVMTVERVGYCLNDEVEELGMARYGEVLGVSVVRRGTPGW